MAESERELKTYSGEVWRGRIFTYVTNCCRGTDELLLRLVLSDLVGSLLAGNAAAAQGAGRAAVPRPAVELLLLLAGLEADVLHKESSA